MKKKILAFLLACTLAVGMAVSPVGTETVWAEDDDYVSRGTTGDGFIYSEYGKHIEIERYKGTATEIEIPKMINNKPVTDICFGGGDVGTSGLTKITIPETVTGISSNAFQECNRLKEILVAEGNSRFVSKDGILYANDTDDGLTLHTYPAGKDNTEVSIPEGVMRIGYAAFYGCSKLTSVKIPSSVTAIGDCAFWGCSGLTSIEIPSSVTEIGVTYFSITLPTGVIKRTWNPFRGCSQLKDILVDGNNSSYKSKDGMLYSNDGVLISYAAGRDNTQVSIPKEIVMIGSYAFFGCSKLTSVSIPSSVTFIDSSAFQNCSDLNSVIIPEGVTTIVGYAFDGCSLNSVIIPKSVTEIGMGAFSSSLKDVYYAGNEEEFSKIISPYDKAFWESRNIQYNFVIPTDTTGKTNQTITAENITKTYGAKAFSLNAKVDTGTALTYVSSNKKVATIDQKGKITIKGCGITNITITAPATDTYTQAQKTITLTVKPKKATLSSVKSTKKKTAAVTWTRNQEASGYLIQCATDSKFNKNKVQVTVSKNKTVSTTVKKLKAGKKYYVRVCAYAKSGKTKVQGNWSKVKTVRVKK